MPEGRGKCAANTANVSVSTAAQLTPDEVEELFAFTIKVSELGMLNGKFKHASIALYWQRIKGEN